MGGEVVILGSIYGAANPDTEPNFNNADTGILTEVNAYGTEVSLEFSYTYDSKERTGRIDFPAGSVMKYADFEVTRNAEELLMPWPTGGGGTAERTFYLED